MSSCSQCGAVLGSKVIGPGVQITVSHRRFELCRGCGASMAMSICLQIRATSVVTQRVDVHDAQDERELSGGMKE